MSIKLCDVFLNTRFFPVCRVSPMSKTVIHSFSRYLLDFKNMEDSITRRWFYSINKFRRITTYLLWLPWRNPVRNLMRWLMKLMHLLKYKNSAHTSFSLRWICHESTCTWRRENLLWPFVLQIRNMDSVVTGCFWMPQKNNLWPFVLVYNQKGCYIFKVFRIKAIYSLFRTVWKLSSGLSISHMNYHYSLPRALLCIVLLS